MDFETWVDSQIREARERGEFDGLAGSGKPLPRDSGDWLANLVRREGGEARREMLPPQLRLRREVELLPERLAGVRVESEARAVVRELNERIDQWMRTGTGPVVVRFVDEEEALAGWVVARERVRAEEEAARERSRVVGAESVGFGARRRRWFRRG
ncbi:DnaJ family domain-containing protein [Actinokineospora bangkokensis]|uniref:DnaJ homologue subfamily C member 28 conserved domain-containing protein n=1 Tax=Actinokineospora bangkokensis TaxID=1193682 RepID=A0A1Q9LPK9_9PSEU|nr:DUF1992 domain-containing protein [Actinokineospora bangkokensis]OLR93941.1 hypothetical protein BJP25_16310 [Actinokineospora bangkokensis]